jgi:hypothetical protein
MGIVAAGFRGLKACFSVFGLLFEMESDTNCNMGKFNIAARKNNEKGRADFQQKTVRLASDHDRRYPQMRPVARVIERSILIKEESYVGDNH